MNLQRLTMNDVTVGIVTQPVQLAGEYAAARQSTLLSVLPKKLNKQIDICSYLNLPEDLENVVVIYNVPSALSHNASSIP